MNIEAYIKRTPRSYFYGYLVDARVDLAYLGDFAESTVRFLRDAASKTATKRELSDGLMAIAEDAEYLYGSLYASDVYQASIIAGVIFLERQIKTFARGLKVGLGQISGRERATN